MYGFEARTVDSLEEPVEGRRAELVHRDRPLAEHDGPRSRYGGRLVEHRCDDDTLGQPVEPVRDHENDATPARLVTAIGEPEIASRRRQPRPSVQVASTTVSTRLRSAR